MGLGVFAVAMFFIAPGSRGVLPPLLSGSLSAIDDLDDVRYVEDEIIRKFMRHQTDESPTRDRCQNAEIARLEAMLQDNNRTDRP